MALVSIFLPRVHAVRAPSQLASHKASWPDGRRLRTGLVPVVRLASRLQASNRVQGETMTTPPPIIGATPIVPGNEKLPPAEQCADWLESFVTTEEWRFHSDLRSHMARSIIAHLRTRPAASACEDVWIEVSESLPEPGIGVLVGWSTYIGYGFRRNPEYLGKRANKWIVGQSPSNSVTHWRPLPPPPSAAVSAGKP